MDSKTPKLAIIEINDVTIDDCESYEINDFFRFENLKGKTVLTAEIEDVPTFSSAPTILQNALLCAFPDILVSTWCKKTDSDFYKDIWKPNILFSYYGYSDYKSKNIRQIKREDLQHLKEWHHIIIDYNKACKENPDLRGTSWNVGYNEYLDASTCGSVEKAYTHLITALEALLVDGSNELNYRVALYAATFIQRTYDKRMSTFDLIKKCYNLRSKAVHGDVEGLKKNFKKAEVYGMLFELKSIVSSILFRTYKREKKDILDSINKALLSCPPVAM